LAWLQARAAGGTFLLRIEDLDTGRCRAELVDELFRDLEYLGLSWDEEPVRQSQRREAYEAAVKQLRQIGKIYDCFCSRAEVARAASAPHGPADDGPRYPGTCANRTADSAARPERRPALRFRASPGAMKFTDRIRGTYEQDVSAQAGDFIVQRNDGVASYQLAVVVDDAFTGVTDVLRGDDLLSSTPRQLQLYQALAAAPPSFAHVPLLIEPKGNRLAKRGGVFAVAELRAQGVPPERVIGLLARWSGLGDEDGPARDWINRFSLSAIARNPVVVDEAQVKRMLKLA
jgi:glutamyl-tRNA synthetase